MTGRRKELECCRYDAEERRLTIPRGRRGRGIGMIVAGGLAAVILAMAVCLTLAGGKNQLAEKFASFSMLNGFLFWSETEEDSGEEPTETTPESASETEEVSGTEDDLEETSEHSRESESVSEEIGSGANRDVVSKDLSFTEYGEGYYINLTDKRVVVHELLNRELSGGLVEDVETPQVLVLHTHTSEAYWDADPEQESHKVLRGVVAVGELVVAELNLRGVPAVHCTVIHDGDSKRDSYEKMAKTVEMMLEIYPSIRYVVDLHRISDFDENGLAVKTCAPDGSAQVRLTVSACDAPQYDDLTLALCLRRRMNEKSVGACMPIVLTEGLDASGEKGCFFLKVEIGGPGNSVEEAKFAGARFAAVLAEVLKQ